MRKYIFLLGILGLLFLSGCNEKNSHECINGTWVFPEDTVCNVEVMARLVCNECGETIEVAPKKRSHNIVVDEQESTCVEDGFYVESCTYCEYEYYIKYDKTGIHDYYYEIYTKATDNKLGVKQQICATCNSEGKRVKYANNGYSDHGKLSVVGPDLVDEHGEKFQLVGISTHGIQWYNKYINYETFDALHNEFGINVIRLALTTAEGGYCEVDDSKREFFYQKVAEGIRIATKLDMYVIVDWHMVGAENPADKNPLTYLEQSKEFFSYISEYYKKQNNILYEIMNEPNGSTTWADCKKYAEEVIPCIRKNTDAVILEENPSWTADLNSVMKDPLVGYKNIMYTYHFYAGDHRNTGQVVSAYDKGFPVFISEFGFMNSDGDGPINESSGQNWLKILDERNISYVAWNISNTKGSASILKTDSTSRINFTDSALKPWGIWYKEWVKAKMNK